ncbi:MAG: hypothetical protein ACE15E_23410 [Acidobacteriota bacterium]
MSLGFARISGTPEDFQAINIRSQSGEQTGDGAAGKIASSLLCLAGRLYMWVRNASNSQLAFSDDFGKTWTWYDWRFVTSFGHPVFLNYGKDYAGARDDYVYVYSHDQSSDYRPADRIVLAQVPTAPILNRDTYEFFVKMMRGGAPSPEWHPASSAAWGFTMRRSPEDRGRRPTSTAILTWVPGKTHTCRPNGWARTERKCTSFFRATTVSPCGEWRWCCSCILPGLFFLDLQLLKESR